MNKIILPNGSIAVMAEYKEQIVDDYKGNPFIECLPNLCSKEDTIEKLAVYPNFNEDERFLETHYRLHIISQRLFKLFQPLPMHLELENKISTMIRLGYISRNPFKKEYTEMLIEGYNDIHGVELNADNTFNSTALSLSIIGSSGLGKTSSINRILSDIPQIICHKNYKGMKFSMYQVTWIKLDCTYDGSVKGLCIDFFNKVDKLLGTNYFIKYGASKRTVDTMLSVMSQIARNIGLGLLVVDEIQHLSQSKSGGSDKMLNFFTSLTNIVNIPIILVGTMAARNILQADFRMARRTIGSSGNVVWDRLKKDESWELLIDSIWEYQWTRNKTPLTKEFIELLYEESQGIIDIAVKIYCMVQIKAISTGVEEIAVDLIKEVVDKNLNAVRPMLDAMKSNDLKKIAKYQDICTVEYEEFLLNETKEVDFVKRIKEYKEAKKLKTTNVREQAIIKLIELDIDRAKATKSVDRIIDEEGIDIQLKDLVISALKIIDEVSTKKERLDFKCEDIRKIINIAIENNETSYEGLKAAGYILRADCNWEEFI